MLSVRDLFVQFKGFEALRGVSLDITPGQWVMLAGPNGAGKSSLIKAVAKAVPYRGSVRLQGQDTQRLGARAMAHRLAVLEQAHAVGYSFTVEQLVALGRYAHQSPFSHADPGGRDQVDQAISQCGLQKQRHQNVLTLSGGELQRAFLAQVFAQDAPLLILDEPASHLDLPFQQAVFSLIADWLKTPGRAVLSVVHDLLLARRYGTHALLLNQGQVVASGDMDAVFTPKNLREAYGMDVGAWFEWLNAPWRSGQSGGD